MNELKTKIKENPDERVLVIMLILCFILVIAVVSVNIINAPKFEEPVFTSSAVEEDISYLNSSYNSSVTVSESETIYFIGINTATIDELQKIPGIGPVTAQKIVDYRNENGTIVEFSELLNIDGIGEKTVETISEYCVIN